MNKFEKQLSQVAQTLRNKHNETLRVPSPPRVTPAKTWHHFMGWIGMAAALCVGYFLGSISPYPPPETPSPLSLTSRTEILRDTIFSVIRDTLFIEREIPIYHSTPTKKKLAGVLPPTDSIPSSSSPKTTIANIETGKSILDDTIHYTLLVSM